MAVWISPGSEDEFVDQDYRDAFPDEAVLVNQLITIPFNDGAVSPRQLLLEQLRVSTNKINAFERLHAPTECTEIDTTSQGLLNLEIGDLQGGQYACFNK